MTFINPHINLSIEWFYAQVYRRKGGKINTDSAAAHPSPQGQELVGFLAPEAGSVSGRQVLSPFSLNQIKSWKQLKAHPLSGLIPSLCLTTNTVSFQAGLVQAALGQAVAWKVDRASLFPLPCAVRGHDPLSSPGLVNLPALASAPSTWPSETPPSPWTWSEDILYGHPRCLFTGSGTLGQVTSPHCASVSCKVGIMVPTSKVAVRIVNMMMYRKCPAHSCCSINVSFLFYLPIASHASIIDISVHHQYDPHIFLYINTPLKLHLSSTNRKPAALGKHLLLCLVNIYWCSSCTRYCFRFWRHSGEPMSPHPQRACIRMGEMDGEQIEIEYDIKWHKARLVKVRDPFHFVGSAEVDFPNANEA